MAANSQILYANDDPYLPELMQGGYMNRRQLLFGTVLMLLFLTVTMPNQAFSATTRTFSSRGGIAITNSSNNQKASPYPSAITVSGVAGTVKKIRVKLNNYSHPYPSDVGVYLVGPRGQNIVLMNNVGGDIPVSGSNLVLDDAGALLATPGTSGTYRPTDYGTYRVFVDAPAKSYDTRLSIFNGIDPNGQWQLYVMDFSGTHTGTGSILGWQIEIQTTALEVTATPAIKTAGSPFDVTVTARNADNTVDTAYSGTVYFTSSDPDATLPVPYTFVPGDAGSHTFSGVALNSHGDQTITVSDGGIIGHWKLDEGSGTSAADASGSANTATLNGPPAWSTDLPVTKYGNGGSLLFSGTANSVVIPKTTALQLTTSTTMAWIKADADVSAERYIWSDNSSNAGSSCRLTQSSGNLICEMRYGVFTINTGVALNDSTWHHVAFAIDDTAKTATVYVDGAVAASTVYSASMVPSTNPIKLGQFSFFNGSPFLGLLDDVRIYKRALTAAETALLAAGTDAEAKGTSAVLAVVQPPGISVQPQSQIIKKGQTATLSVTATGDGITFQWYQGASGDTSSPIADATTNTFTTPPLTASAGYWVRVASSYSLPAVDSATAQLTVIQAATSFALTGAPANAFGGTAFSLTVTALNPDGTTDTGYNGTVHFSSTDAAATLPSAYTFAAADAGSHTFSNVLLNSSGSHTVTVFDSGMSGYWNLDTSTSMAFDTSGNYNHGYIDNNPVLSSDVPALSFTDLKSLAFNATNSYVAISKTASLSLQSSTIAIWFKADASVTSRRSIISDRALSTGYTCFLAGQSDGGFSPGELVCDISGTTVRSGSQLNDNTWHHLALAIDNASAAATIYVDGIKKVTASVAYATSTYSLLLAQVANLGTQPFLGNLDEVRVYNRVLTTAEVALLAAGSAPDTAISSTTAVITVNAPARITAQPQSVSILRGGTATVSVTATGDGTLSYQWYQGTSGVTAAPIPGANTSSYTTPPLVAPSSYWVRVTGTYGPPVNSVAARVITATGLSSFSTTSPITINDNSGATPYPSSITVSGFTGTLDRVRVVLNGVNHAFPPDMGVLLVGPHGQKVVLMDGVGDSSALTNGILAFEDSGPDLTSSAISSGTYHPTNLRGSNYPVPAPAGPYDSNLSVFANSDPNGIWRLYVRDATAGNTGSISGGWQLELSSLKQAAFFEITGTPASTNGGTAFNMTVTAKNADNTTDSGYPGTIYFSSTDANAVLPQPYTFTPGDNGTHTFSGVSFGSTGSHTISVTDSAMEGYWKLDERTGLTVADSSGNDNTGSSSLLYWNTNDVAPTQFTNSAAVFFNATASGNYISVPKTAPLTLSTVTIAIWIKADTSVPTYRTLFSDRNTGAAAGYACYLEQTTGVLNCEINNQPLTSGLALNDNAWHHVALVIDKQAGKATIYVDGTARQSIDTTLSPSSLPLLIGAYTTTYQYLFKGLLDDVRVYSRALAPAELATLAAGDGPDSVTRGKSATVTVTTPATAITVQPRSVNITGGQAATLTVTAIGGGTLSYQWYQGTSGDTTTPIANATSDSYTTPPLHGPATYWVQVTGPYGAPVNSASAQVITAASKAVINNSAAITINDNAAASPYPSTITVSGFSGTVELMRVTLNGINHTWPQDLGVLLVGPQGQNVLLMLNAGGGTALAGTVLVFDDTGSALTTAAIVSGVYRPTRLTGANYPFAAPAPAAPYGNNLALFNSTDPNGEWQLYLQDFATGDSGAISGGWSIEFLSKTHSLKISVGGSGHGTVSYQEKSAVINSSYETSVVTGQQVSLEPLPDQFSLFAGWAGVTGCSTGICQFSLTDNTTATATFTMDSANSVLVDPLRFAAINAAYRADTTMSGSTIKLWGIDFAEELLFDLNKSVTLSGNYNSTYSVQGNDTVSTISGPITIKSGEVIADRITIK